MKHYNDKNKSFNRNYHNPYERALGAPNRRGQQFRTYHHNARGGRDYNHHRYQSPDRRWDRHGQFRGPPLRDARASDLNRRIHQSPDRRLAKSSSTKNEFKPPVRNARSASDLNSKTQSPDRRLTESKPSYKLDLVPTPRPKLPRMVIIMQQFDKSHDKPSVKIESLKSRTPDEIAKIDAAVERTWAYVMEQRQCILDALYKETGVVELLVEDHENLVSDDPEIYMGEHWNYKGANLRHHKAKWDRVSKQGLRDCLVRCMEELDEYQDHPTRNGCIMCPINKICVSFISVILSFSFSICLQKFTNSYYLHSACKDGGTGNERSCSGMGNENSFREIACVPNVFKIYLEKKRSND